MEIRQKIIVIVGPTAVGKSKVAIELAERFDGEIVNADSMQVYRYMDIGTAKPSAVDRERVSHHLIDIRNPDEDFDAARFQEEASKAIVEIVDKGKLPIVVGGTGLYIKALTEGIFDAPGSDKELREKLRKEAEDFGMSVLYNKLFEVDPESAGRIGPRNTHRLIRALEVFYLTGISISQYQKGHAFSDRPYDTFKIGLTKERETLYKDIDDRIENMVKAGLVDEVRRIIEMGYSPGSKAMNALGYSHICRYLKGEYDLEEAVRLIKRDTRHYAKRQMTWFRKDAGINWCDVNKEGCIGHIFSEVGGFAGKAS